MLRPLSSVTLPFLALASVSAQEVEIPIHDLVGPRTLAAFESREKRQYGLEDWIHRQNDPGIEKHVWVTGEGTLLADRGAAPWFRSRDLRAVLGALTQLGEDSFEVEDGMLRVAAAQAAAAREGLLWLRRQLPPRIALEVKLERRTAAGSDTILHVRQDVRAGSTVTFTDLAQRQILRDYDVEIAQSAATANPIVDVLATGACLAVRPRVVPGKAELLIEVYGRIADDAEAPPIEVVHDGTGPIDRAARELSECGVALRVPRGATRTVEWTSSDGDQLRLSCAGSWEDAKPGPRRGVVVRCHALFDKPVAEFRTDVFEPEDRPASFATEAAFNSAGAESLLFITGDGSATSAVVLIGPNAEQIDADVASKLAQTLESAVLEVSLLDVSADAGLEAASTQGVGLARIESPVIVGKSVAFSGRTEMQYLHDWDVEVAQSARVPDPKVRVMRHGYHVDARVIGDGRGGFDTVSLDGSVARLARIDSKRATINRELRAGGVPDKNGTISPSIVLPQDEIAIESPVVHRQTLSGKLHLDESGRATIRRAAPRLLGKGRDLVVIVRVTK